MDINFIVTMLILFMIFMLAIGYSQNLKKIRKLKEIFEKMLNEKNEK